MQNAECLMLNAVNHSKSFVKKRLISFLPIIPFYYVNC